MPTKTNDYTVYRLYDAGDSLLFYVGCTKHLKLKEELL
jgi:hypothetical protein